LPVKRRTAPDRLPRGSLQHLQPHAVHRRQYHTHVFVASVADRRPATDQRQPGPLHFRGESAADVPVPAPAVLRGGGSPRQGQDRNKYQSDGTGLRHGREGNIPDEVSAVEPTNVSAAVVVLIRHNWPWSPLLS